MRAVDYSLAVRDFLYAVHKNGAFALEFFDDKAIVDNFFAHINRRTEGFKSNSDDSVRVSGSVGAVRSPAFRRCGGRDRLTAGEIA